MVGTTGERDLEGLRLEAGDIKACHEVAVTTHFFDVLDSASFPAFVDALPVLPERLYRARLATSRCQSDLKPATIIMHYNYEGPALLLENLDTGTATVVGVSSVAGDLPGIELHLSLGEGESCRVPFPSSQSHGEARSPCHYGEARFLYARR